MDPHKEDFKEVAELSPEREETSFEENFTENEAENTQNDHFSNNNNNNIIQDSTIEPSSQESFKKRDQFETVEWEKDQDVLECRKCSQKFGFFLRRHHCRGCGKIFCDVCSQNFLLLPALPQFGSNGYTEPVRVCNECFIQYNVIEHMERDYDCFEKKKDAPILIMIHGAPFNRKIFAKQAEVFSENFKVLTIDLPCHGSKFSQDHSLLNIDTCVHDVLQVLDNETDGKGSAFILGHNIGNIIAIQFGLRHYARCLGVICIGAISQMFSPTSKLGRLALSAKIFPNSVLSKWASSDFENIVPQNVIEESILRAGTHYNAIGRSSEIWSKGSRAFKEGLMVYRGPVLFLVGDQASDRNEEEEVDYSLMRNVTLIPLRGASELCFLEANVKNEVNESIKNWIENCILTQSKPKPLISEPEIRQKAPTSISFVPPEPVMIPRDDSSSGLMDFLSKKERKPKNDPFEL